MRRPGWAPCYSWPTRWSSSIVVNVLSESTFLLFWTWGLWAAVRFLREGRFSWLPLAIGFGILAYLSRPEGMLLPLAMVATLGLLPFHRSTRINWPRWWRAVAFLVLGSLALAGPFMAMKGGPGTKPAIARVLGLAPASPPEALERERPLPADQSVLTTYRPGDQPDDPGCPRGRHDTTFAPCGSGAL